MTIEIKQLELALDRARLEVDVLRMEREALLERVDGLQNAVRNQRGDDLCWITDEGAAKALPKEEFHESCERHRLKIASERGEFTGGRTITELEAENERLKQECDELQRTFDLRWAADMRAIARWRGGDPEKQFRLPDHADLCCWLLAQLEERGRDTERLDWFDAYHGCEPMETWETGIRKWVYMGLHYSSLRSAIDVAMNDRKG